ncbi:unnamed protein product [Caenorhabditis angaria]|uniref:Uncharacterized protein n=1 Tax=Caenorhabditis angaria TaxID=860376 RepID=A0A9P1N9N5_9PELO|nr:unnamed protein product [Caenorhabditis angaria]
MHRTKHSNCAIRCPTNHSAMQQMKSKSTSNKQITTPMNLDEEMGDLIKREVGVSNVHHLITENSKKSKKVTKKSSQNTVSAPETALTPPSTPSSPVESESNEQFEFLIESWTKFTTNENGEPDDSIIVYKAENVEEKIANFVPFNIDRFLAEKMLTELDIDTKFAQF